MAKLFRARSKENSSTAENPRMLGTTVREELDALLSIYATYLGITKSRLMRNILEDWYSNSERHSEEQLINLLAKETYKELQIRLKTKRSDHSDEKIYRELKDEIWNSGKRSKRGLYNYQIKRILERLEQLRNEETQQYGKEETKENTKESEQTSE